MTSLSNLLTHLRARFHREAGATMVEYGLMVALIAIVALVAVQSLGGGVQNIFGDACDELTDAACVRE